MRALESFPPGHPSSPYQADGSHRPAEPSLRSLELPIPDEWAEEWDLSTSDQNKGASEWGNGGDWTASWEEWGAAADAPGDVAGRHGDDVGRHAGDVDRHTGDAGGRYVDSAGRGGDAHAGDGSAGQTDWNDGPGGSGAPGGGGGSADARTGRADDAVHGTSGLTKENRGQAGEIGNTFIPEEPPEKQGTADNTAGRTRADNAQTADAMSPPEGIHRTYWTEVPRFKSLWGDHEAAWPKETQPAAKIDRSGDPPGSWRSDSNLFLNVDLHAQSREAIDNVQQTEKWTTEHVHDVEQKNAYGGRLEGLGFRLKGQDRLKEKVAEVLKREPDRTPEEVVREIPDAVRYTFCIDKDNYTDGCRDIRARIQDLGYDMIYSKNFWSDPEYKGINTRWMTPDGHRFEVQFHTQESYHAKQEVTHEAYERIRNPQTSRAELTALHKFQREVSSWVPVPDDAMDIPDYPKKGR